jgi:hypothetical protein
MKHATRNYEAPGATAITATLNNKDRENGAVLATLYEYDPIALTFIQDQIKPQINNKQV